MASKTQVWKRIGPAIGQPVTVPAKADLSMNRHGYSQPGGFGGGKNTAHVGSAYLAHLVIGVCSPLPSRAGELVDEAYRCIHVTDTKRDVDFEVVSDTPLLTRSVTKDETTDRVRPISLVAYIQAQIEMFAGVAAAERAAHLSDNRTRPYGVQLRLDPLSADVEIPVLGSIYVRRFLPAPEMEKASRGDLGPALTRMRFLNPPGQIAPLNRGVWLPLKLLIVAGDLLADSWAATGETLPLSGQGEAPARSRPKTESPENEKTSDRPGSEASRNSNRSKTKSQTEPSSSSEIRCTASQAQAPMGLQKAGQRKGGSHDRSHEIRP